MSPYKDPIERAEKAREYREKNKEKLLKRNRSYYKDNQGKLVEYAREYRKTDKYRKRVTEYKRQYAVDNKDKINAKVREWYLNNKEKAAEYRKAWAKENPDKRRQYVANHLKKLRTEVFEAYGGIFCACCGESGLPFLTIDHINGDGAEHRRTLKGRGGKDFYSWLRKNNYPPAYQVLCFNCNMAKGTLEFCPHQLPRP